MTRKTHSTECVICYKFTRPSRANANADLPHFDNTKSTTAGIEEGDCETVKRQLPIIILLRKLLNIPKEICSQLLKKHGHPNSWIYSCDSCSALMTKAENINKQINVLQHQLHALRTEIAYQIILSEENILTVTRGTKGKQAFDKGNGNSPTDIIRSYVFQEQRDKLKIDVKDEIEDLDIKEETTYIDDEFYREHSHSTVINKPSANVNLQASQNERDDDSDWNPGDANNSDSEDEEATPITNRVEKLEDGRSKLDSALKEKREDSPNKKNGRESRDLNNTPICCEVCSREFRVYRNLRRHYQKCHGELPYKCEPCNFKLSCQKEVKSHNERYHRTGVGRFKCKICLRTIGTPWGLTSHMKKQHSETQVHPAPIEQKTHLPCKPSENGNLQASQNERDDDSNWNPGDANNSDSEDEDATPITNRVENLEDGRSKLDSALKEKREDSPNKKNGRETRDLNNMPICCEVCSREFRIFINLRHHYRRCHGELPYKCETCNLKLSCQKEVEFHNERYHRTGAGRFKCKICLRTLSTPRGLTNHMKKQHSETQMHPAPMGQKTPLPCKRSQENVKVNNKNCVTMGSMEKSAPHSNAPATKDETTKVNDDFTELNVEVEMGHVNAEELGNIFGESSAVDTEEFETGKKLVCDICPGTLDSHLTYREHYLRNHEEFVLDCKRCNYKPVSNSDLQKHNKEIHKIKIKKHKCIKCDNKAFGRKEQLVKHVEQEHPGEYDVLVPPNVKKKPKEKLKCHICGFRLRSMCNLNQHLRMHAKYRPVICDICGASFTTTTYLKEHQRSQHYEQLGLDPYKCPILECGRFFKSPQGLDGHVKAAHEKAFNFFCDVCNKGFLKIRDLNIHKMMHRDERPILCGKCGAGFRSNTGLKLHDKRVHLKEKPFACKLCPDKTFAEKNGLARHMQGVHSIGAKSHTCHICQKTFPVRNYLYIHMRSHKRKGEI